MQKSQQRYANLVKGEILIHTQIKILSRIETQLIIIPQMT